MDFIYGIVLILVTLFVHRFTWTSEVGEGVYRRAKFPLILVVLIVVLGIIPIVNYVAFVCGGIVYVINLIASSGKTRFSLSSLDGKRKTRFSLSSLDGKPIVERDDFWDGVADFFTKDLGNSKKKK